MVYPTHITVGTKLRLHINGVTRVYEVKLIQGGQFRLYNKFVISFWADLDFIKKSIV